MTWWPIPMCAVVMGFLGWLWRLDVRAHNTVTKYMDETRRRNAFHHANAEREQLAEWAENNPAKVFAPHRGESSWNYIRRLADGGCLGPLVKPWEPSWNGHIVQSHGPVPGDPTRHAYSTPWDPSSQVWVTTGIQCWTVTLEGVVHRAAKLKLINGDVVYVTMCETHSFLDRDVSIDVHTLEDCPVITCLACVTKASH